MNISAVTINQIFKTYRGQARIAELNSQNPVKRLQGQRERVSISQEARDALTAHVIQKILKPSDTRDQEAQPVQDKDVGPEANEAASEPRDSDFTRTNFVE